MNAPTHQTYADSNISWIGRIPATWKVLRIKDTTYVKGRVGWKGLTSDEYLQTGHACLVTGTDFRAKFIDWASCYQVDQFRYDDDPFIQLENGDLLITKDGTIGKLAIVSNLAGPACLNSGIFLVRPQHSYTTEFLYWVLASEVFTVFCDLTSYGSTIQHLYQNVFERFSFPVPPLPEQTAIAAFLDRETSKIDALVEEQKRLIEVLKEKRQAVISHAVTKGLNPDARMKASGIEWLGKVPEHWEVNRLSRLAHPGTAITYGIVQAGPDIDGGVPYIRTSDMANDELSLDGLLRTSAEIDASYARSRVGAGDLVIAIRATIGKPLIVPPELEGANLTQGTAKFCPSERIMNQYAAQFLRSTGAVSEFERVAKGATFKEITLEMLRRFPVLVPPLEEQRAICRYVIKQGDALGQLLRDVEASILLLLEHRSALISAAVTGKIDVRGIAEVEDAA